MDYFKDKVAIVTGGASGIGRAFCEQLGNIGAEVIIADINTEDARKVASAIVDSGGRSEAIYLDVSQMKDVQKFVEETSFRYGRLDFMFNNAGTFVIGEAYDMTHEHWNRIIDVNLRGVVNGTAAAYPLMVKQGFGHIVNTSSWSGLMPMAMSAAYAAASHGIVGLSTSLRLEGADLGVKVSVSCPGRIQTSFYDKAFVLNADREDVRAAIRFKPKDAGVAAKIILSGVEQNRDIIIFPFHARFFRWLYRIHPSLAAPLTGGIIKKFRALRKEP